MWTNGHDALATFPVPIRLATAVEAAALVRVDGLQQSSTQQDLVLDLVQVLLGEE